MIHPHTFQNVINAVAKTGLGYKEFFFRTNLSYDEIIDSHNFGDGRPLGDIFIIKFSDGENCIGTLTMTEDEFDSAFGSGSDKNIALSEFHNLFPLAEINIDLHLKFGIDEHFDDPTMGKALVSIYSRKRDEETIKRWWQSENMNDLPMLLEP